LWWLLTYDTPFDGRTNERDWVETLQMKLSLLHFFATIAPEDDGDLIPA